jgi:hypothetical protein
MNQVTIVSDPLSLFESHSHASDAALVAKFMLMIKHLYQYYIFKPLLDLSASQIKYGFLTFKLYDQRIFDLDEGNCRTIYGSKINHFLNSVRPRNVYLITLKKLSYDVVIHEMAHMVEKEGKIDLLEFERIIKLDMAHTAESIGLANAIKQVLVQEVGVYPKSQQASELFARYFQVMAMSKEIAGLASVFGYSINASDSYFHETKKWLLGHLYPALFTIIDAQISNISTQYVKQVDEIKHKWSEQKTQPIHHNKTVQWSKVTKSIKD